MNSVWVYYEDTDNNCGDSDCCGGPSPDPIVKIFSTLEKAKEAGYAKSKLKEIKIDSNEETHLGW